MNKLIKSLDVMRICLTFEFDLLIETKKFLRDENSKIINQNYLQIVTI